MNEPAASELLKQRREEERAYAAGDFAALAEALAGQAGQVKTEPERAGLVLRAGVAAFRAGNPDRAVELLKQAGKEALPAALGRFIRLEIHWGRGEWKELIELIGEELAGAGAFDRAALRLEKARILALRLGLVEDAQAELDGILSEKPECREALWLKLALHLRSGSWDKVAEIYGKIAALAEADQDAALSEAVSLRRAQIEEMRFKRIKEAAALYDKLAQGREPALGLAAAADLLILSGDFGGAARALKELIESASQEAEPPAAMRLLVARIQEHALNDPKAAAAELEILASKRPGDFNAVYAFAHAAMEGGTPESRTAAEEKLCSLLQDPKEISYFAADRARLLVEDLGQYEPAVSAARHIMEVIPEDGSAPRWMIEALRRNEKYAEAIQEIDQLIARTNDPRVRQGLLFTKAELATHKLGDQKTALSAYNEAMQIPPSHMPVLVSMARIYHVNKDWDNLSRFLVAVIKMVQDPGPRKFYQGWLAGIYLERLSREDQAFALFGEIVKADPADRAALKTIIRISQRKASWNNVGGALSRIIEDSKDPALRSYNRALLAWLFETKINQKDKALALYNELAKEGDVFSLEGVARLSLAKGDTPAYTAALSALAEPLEQGRLRAARLTRLAGALEVQGELAGSWAAYEKARGVLLDQTHLHLSMIDLAQLAGYWGRYQALIEDLAPRIADESKKALIWEAAWSRAEIPGEDGNADVAGMLAAFQSLTDAGSVGLGQRGTILAAAWAQDHRARAGVIAQMVTQVPEPLSLAVRMWLAYTLRDDLGAKEESIAAFRQVLSKDPKNSPLIRELALMYNEAGQWGELIRMMLLEIPLRREPDVLIDMYARLAHLYEDKFKAVDEAIKCHATILKMAPARAESHEERIRLLESKSRWEEMAKALHEFEAVTQDPAAKITILVRAATVLDEKLKDANRAIADLKKALDLDPTRDDLLSALERIYEREQRFEELVGVLIAQAGRVPDPKVKAVLHERAAGIQDEKLGDPAKAISNLIVARDFDPERQSVLLSLERLFTGAQRWEELIDTLERLAARGDGAAKIGYYSRIGALWDEQLGKLPESIASWERVRPLDPNHVPALDALVSLYQRTGDDPNFVERSVTLAELVTEDKPKSVGLLTGAGAVLETRLNDVDRALSLYLRGMEIDSHAAPPVRAARSIYERREAWPDVVRMWLAEEAIVAEVSRKLEIFTIVGHIHEEKTRDADQAIQAYENALKLQGDYLPSVEPLSEIYYTQQNHQKARPLFEIRVTNFTGQTAEVKGVVWWKCGDSAEKLGDVPAAMERFKKSVESIPEHRPPLERLSELYTAQEKWPEAETFTGRLLAVVSKGQDLEAAFTVLLRKGLIEDKLNKLPEAAASYEQALQIKPNHYPTWVLLIDLYLRTKEWKKSLLAYDNAVKTAPNKEAAADNLVGKGQVLEDHLNEEKSALAHFQAAVKHAPAHLEGWRRISGIQYRTKNWPEAETALQNCIKLDKDKGRLVQHHYTLGRVYIDGLDNLDKAEAAFKGALALDKVHVPSMQSLLDIFLKVEKWKEFMDTGENFIRLAPEESQASLIPTYINLGRVYRDHGDNKERAVIHFQTAIKLSPEDQDARAELASLYLSDPKFIDQAKAENRRLIHMEPWRPQTYRDLMAIYKKQNNLDAVFYISAILKHLDTLDYEEEMFYEANRNKVRLNTRKALNELERDGQLLHNDERGPLHTLLLAMSENMKDFFPMSPDRMGAKKNHLADAKTSHPLKDLAGEFFQALGYEGDFALYIVPGLAEPLVLPGSPTALLVNAEWFNKFEDNEKRFIMARLMEHAADRHGLLLQFPPEKVMQMFALLAMGMNPRVQVEPPGGMPANAEKLKKALAKAVPRAQRTAVEHAAERFTQEVLIDPEQWKRACLHTANRAGLLFCGEPFTAFDAIIKADPQYRNVKYQGIDIKEKMEIWSKHPEIVELLDFAMSDQHLRLRQRLGISIT